MKRQLDSFIQQITADKKKLSVMLCAMALGLLLWGRLLLQDVPRTATAGEKTVAEQINDDQLTENEQAEQTDKPLPVVYVDLPTSPGRDLFGWIPNRYRQNHNSGPGNTIAKSAQVTPDDDPRIAAVRQEAMELHLESVVTGTQPRAYINGRLLAPGDEYKGFTLMQVTDRHVLLTKYGLIIKLRM